MKVLLIGNGGREHALAYKIAQSSKVEKIYCSKGNGGTAVEEKCENVNLSTIEELANFAEENKIDLTIVGPEKELCDGIVDEFKSRGLKIFGPSKEAAKLEGSKAFSKDFMKKYGVKTAEYGNFDNLDEALRYVERCEIPVVVKADGLAAGKGVIIASTREEAIDAVKELMENRTLGDAGKTIVIEEFLEGVEASILSITDGEVIIPFISSKDHKAIGEGNTGLNTGGMGTIAPNPYCTDEVLKDFSENIMIPTLEGIKKENLDYIGIIFFGVMITKKGVYLLEYNVRMGDPETQVVLPLMESDLVEVINSAINKNLKNIKVLFKNAYACCVIGASKGYPKKYEKGFEITGIDNSKAKTFFAGVKEEDGKLLTNGGRVLGVTSIGKTLEQARANAYAGIESIKFDGMYYRKDIGK